MANYNPPFSPVTFPTQVPATKPAGLWNTFTGPQEDGPSIYANSGPIFYNGLNQTSKINAAVPPPISSPAKCVLPGAARGMSAIP